MKDICRVLGNSVRVRLLTCLAHKQKNVSELINTCGLSQSAVSQHLKKLKSAGLVTTVKNGKEVYYGLKNKKIAEVSALLLSLEQEGL